MQIRPIGILGAALGALQLAAAAAAAPPSRQDAASLGRTVSEFVHAQTAGLPGQVELAVGQVDPRLALPACPAPEAFLPAGGRLWGNSTVGVRCSGDKPWTVFVPVQVRVTGSYQVAARPLAAGQPISTADLTPRTGDLTQLPAGIVTDPAQAAGKTPAMGMAAGQPLRLDLLRSPLVVQQGQSVMLQSMGRGFTVRAEGKALSQAADGQVVQVRSASGTTVSGIARVGGVVDVSF